MITPEHIMFKTIREVARPRLRSCLRASPGRWSRGQGPCPGGPLTRCPPLGWRSKAVTASRTRPSAMLIFTSCRPRTSRGRTGRPTYGTPPGADHRRMTSTRSGSWLPAASRAAGLIGPFLFPPPCAFSGSAGSCYLLASAAPPDLR